MQRGVVHKHSSGRDVRHKVLLQLLVPGEKVSGKWLGLGVYKVNAIFDLFYLQTQDQNIVRISFESVCQRAAEVPERRLLQIYGCYMKADKYY